MTNPATVRFRATERTDIPLFVTWFNDPEVTAGTSGYLPMSTVGEEAWFEGMMKRPAEERPLMIEAFSDLKWTPVGNCGLFDINWRIRCAELGIAIGAPGARGQGYGTQAMRLLVDHGFGMLNLNRIYLRVFDNNPRAIHVYEKVGFVHEGRQRQAEYKNGAYHDLLMMSILRQDWNPPAQDVPKILL